MRVRHAHRMDLDTLLAELDREQHGRYLKAARSRDERDMIASSIRLLGELTPYGRTRNRRRPNRALRALALTLIATMLIGAGIAVYRAATTSNPATYTLNN